MGLVRVLLLVVTEQSMKTITHLSYDGSLRLDL